ncbi:MAG: hypothetical protein GXO09_04055 [Crenarchaeota archaeon]|nr:hypothetical protein [Thermoproteota archaeon]
MPKLVYERIAETAQVLKTKTTTLSRAADTFTDPRYYPPRDADKETVTAYFLVMVAMDHRLSRPGRPYEAVVDGERHHGADLLYRLGALKLSQDPDFFTAKRLARITARELLEWLCIDDKCPPDPERRTILLRDLGQKLIKLYDSNPYTIIEESKGRLNGTPEEPGLIQLLGVFMAYNDPVWKKTMLLAKFLERRGILTIRDKDSKRVPVDNHVARIAYRLGIVEVEQHLKPLLEWRREATPQEDTLLRTAVREAWHLTAVKAGIDDFTLDDTLWTYGRKTCTPEKPQCTKCSHPICTMQQCPFLQLCRNKQLKEHLFHNTWWY